MQVALGKKLCQGGRYDQAGEIVIRQRRMTRMARDEHLISGATTDAQFPVRQMTILEGRVDAYFIVVVFKGKHLIMGQTKSPIFLVVRRSIRNPIGVLGESEQVRLQFTQRHRCVHRSTVIQYVQVALLEVYDSLAGTILYICVPDIPFLGHGPVEHRCPRWHFPGSKRNFVPNHGQGLPNSIPSNAATDRVKFCGKAMQLDADSGSTRFVEFS